MQKGIMLKKCKKNKAYIICSSFVSFLQCYGHISYRHAFLSVFIFSCGPFHRHQHLSHHSLFSWRSFHSYSSLQYPFRVFSISFIPPCLSQKDTPRAFGASLRRHAAPWTLVLTFLPLASTLRLRLSRTLGKLFLPHTLFHATAEGLSRPPNAPLRYTPYYLLEALT